MKTFFKILLVSGLFASCSDVEPVEFNGQEGNPTFISFSKSVYSLPVERDATGSVDIVLNSSTLSSVDRTYNFELVPSTSLLAADPATYTIPASVTIPAGQYSGIATINGQDLGLVDATRKNFSIRINNMPENEDFDSDTASVIVYEVCALQAPFLGQYEVEQQTSESPNTGEDIIPDGIYTLKEGETPYDRFISFVPYGDASFGLSEIDMLITFGCDDVNMFGEYDTDLSCEDDGGDPSIRFGASETPNAYDIANDETFELELTENIESACGGSPRSVIIRFTKVE
jgi:hypothetical protein